MITAVRSNQETFRTIEFKPGFNVVLADITERSTERDTRNGLGKTTLLEIIHFCLGSSGERGAGLLRNELQEWAFTLDLKFGDREVSATREVAHPSRVTLTGEVSQWSALLTRDEAGRNSLAVEEWRRVLGIEMFGFDQESGPTGFKPSFRSLFPYFARYRRGAFETPFKFFANQPAWSQQVNNAFLLGLAWEDASSWHALNKRREALTQLRRAAAEGYLSDVLGSVGELEARKVALDVDIARLEAELASFRVHPQYDQVVEQANTLTERIHALTNANVVARRKLALYEAQLREEAPGEQADVVRLWEEAGAELGDVVRRRLEDVTQFHRQVIENRRLFLREEMERTANDIEARRREVEQLSEQRRDLMEVLETHGALEEFTVLQRQLAELRERSSDLASRIARIREIEESEATAAIEAEELMRRMRRDYEEREEEWSEAITLFADNTRALYDEPGALIIDIGRSGFSFRVEIARSASHGVNNMKIFCYDLMLAQKWSSKPKNTGVLVHDSEIFDGVDERQVAAALRLASQEAGGRNFQYICTINSDAVPREDLLEGVGFGEAIVLRLTDETDSGRLLGIAF